MGNHANAANEAEKLQDQEARHKALHKALPALLSRGVRTEDIQRIAIGYLMNGGFLAMEDAVKIAGQLVEAAIADFNREPGDKRVLFWRNDTSSVMDIYKAAKLIDFEARQDTRSRRIEVRRQGRDWHVPKTNTNTTRVLAADIDTQVVHDVCVEMVRLDKKGKPYEVPVCRPFEPKETKVGQALARMVEDNQHDPFIDYLEGNPRKYAEDLRVSGDFEYGRNARELTSQLIGHTPPDEYKALGWKPTPEAMRRHILAHPALAVVTRAYRARDGKDTVLYTPIHAGPEPGCFKSSLFHLVTPTGQDWVKSSSMLSDYKEIMHNSEGAVFVELGEMVGFNQDPNKTKRVLGDTIDHFRPSYGHHNITVIRGFQFYATTNNMPALQPVREERRFQPFFFYKKEGLIEQHGTSHDIQLWAQRLMDETDESGFSLRDRIWGEAIAGMEAGISPSFGKDDEAIRALMLSALTGNDKLSDDIEDWFLATAQSWHTAKCAMATGGFVPSPKTPSGFLRHATMTDVLAGLGLKNNQAHRNAVHMAYVACGGDNAGGAFKTAKLEDGSIEKGRLFDLEPIRALTIKEDI